ncbi:N-acetylmuramoyl-L-alanine amidase [Frankia sp. Cj3]|uniref:peptidoglycan recognition protein family protein n=4 Tax=unclassified Frankia TaxID=2632575 RepID=UPI001EF4EF55|nr:N-acetylmuramoyl-L-alanine amidase [Frankia sp. Cj3]
MAHLVPGFTFRPVRNTDGDAIRPIGLVLHVQQGYGGLSGWFDNPVSRASSTLWVGRTGQREQYVPSDVRAWAQAAGNADYDSIETEGFDTEALTDQQIENIAQAYADGVRTFGWALAVTHTPGDSGLIMHSDGGAAWGNHLGCPGTLRAAAAAQIIARAAEIVREPRLLAGTGTVSTGTVSTGTVSTGTVSTGTVSTGTAGTGTVSTGAGGGADASGRSRAKAQALQRAVHVAVDGIWGPVTDTALQAVRANRHTRAEQAAVATTVDGIWGPRSQTAYIATVRAIQAALGVGVDGIWGPVTDRAFVAVRGASFTG